MKVLVVGSGGREHAICRAVAHALTRYTRAPQVSLHLQSVPIGARWNLISSYHLQRIMPLILQSSVWMIR